MSTSRSSPASSAEPRTLSALVRALVPRLRAICGGAARSEAQRLVMLATGVDRTRLAVDPDAPVDAEQVVMALALTERRAAGEPFAYLKGSREFWGATFEVGTGVLVPRPESETMIEAALAFLSPDAAARVVDLGTGSGCLLLTVLRERPHAAGLGVERSPAALAFAKRNRTRLGLEARCLLVEGSWLDAAGGPFDLVLANPPYVTSGEIDALMTDVRDHEPRLALDGGADGLEPHRLILANLPRCLAPGGLALQEIGHEQGAAALTMAARFGFTDARLLKDLAGHDRCLCVSAADPLRDGRCGPPPSS